MGLLENIFRMVLIVLSIVGGVLLILRMIGVI